MPGGRCWRPSRRITISGTPTLPGWPARDGHEPRGGRGRRARLDLAARRFCPYPAAVACGKIGLHGTEVRGRAIITWSIRNRRNSRDPPKPPLRGGKPRCFPPLRRGAAYPFPPLRRGGRGGGEFRFRQRRMKKCWVAGVSSSRPRCLGQPGIGSSSYCAAPRGAWDFDWAVGPCGRLGFCGGCSAEAADNPAGRSAATGGGVFVACNTLCFSREPLESALRHIAELEFDKIELPIVEGGAHLQPSEVARTPNRRCSDSAGTEPDPGGAGARLRRR